MYPLACPAWRETSPTGVVKAWEAAYCTFPHIHYFINTFLPFRLFSLRNLCARVCVTAEAGSVCLRSWLWSWAGWLQTGRAPAVAAASAQVCANLASSHPSMRASGHVSHVLWGFLTASLESRAGLGLCVRGMQRNNVNPCNQNISVQVSTAHQGRLWVTAYPRGRLQWWQCLYRKALQCVLQLVASFTSLRGQSEDIFSGCTQEQPLQVLLHPPAGGGAGHNALQWAAMFIKCLYLCSTLCPYVLSAAICWSAGKGSAGGM